MDTLENAQKRSEYWKNESMAATHEINELKMQIARLRAALAGLIGADTETELRQMEVAMRTLQAPDADKAVSINAIHALLATMTPNTVLSGAANDLE